MDLIPLYKSNIKNILVIGGGGAKGIAALGICSYLYENKILVNPDIYCGTSIGSVIVTLLAIGYKPKELYKLLYRIDFSNLFNFDYEKFLFASRHFGLSSLNNLIEIIIICFEKKNLSKDITFKEFYDLTKKKIIISGTCLNKLSSEYFSVDTYPETKIIDALRISMSIPIITEPQIINKNINGKDINEYWVDGAVMDNYPIQLFNDRLDDVIGIYLMDKFNEELNIEGFDSFFMALLKCFWKGSNFYKLEIYKNQTIVLNCDFEQNIYFKIDKKTKKEMYDFGYQMGIEYYSNKK